MYEGLVWNNIPRDKNFYRIYSNKVAICDRTTKEVVLVVQFTPFDSMSETVKDEFQFVANTLYSASRMAAKITTNKAHLEGNMLGNILLVEEEVCF